MRRFQSLFQTDEIDPESRNRILLIGGMVAVVVVALALVAVGYYVDRVAPRGDTVIAVEGRKFSYAYLEDRAAAAYAEGTFDTENFSFSIAQLVADIQNEELTRLIAEEEGITVSNGELDIGLRTAIGMPPDTATNVFAPVLRRHLRSLDFSLDRFEEIVKVDLLEQKIGEVLVADLPSELEQVELSLIQTDTDAVAAIARDRISDGEDFGEVAAQVSQHSSASQGGVLGWVPRDLLAEDLADAVFALELGEVSDVIETENGFYLALVAGKEVRELDETARTSLEQAYFNERLEEASEQYETVNLVTVGDLQRIASHLQVPLG